MTSINPADQRGAAVKRLTADCTKAERAFANQPKALWSTRSYLSPKSVAAIRLLLDMDWTSRDGARAVMKVLREKGVLS